MDWSSTELVHATFYAHAICLSVPPIIRVLYLVGDMIVVVSCAAIAICTFIPGKSEPIPTRAMLFGIFKICVAASFLLRAIGVYVSVSPFDAIALGVLGASSAVTAYYTVMGRLRGRRL
jgi:hypothetical protein